LTLRFSADAPPVRVGRFLDDISDKKMAFVLPSAHGIQPFFTETNELSVRVAT
jgi:hypothetical protein